MPHGGADLQKLNLRLPKRIATRLTTLQKACPEAVFAADPARCARSSVVGTATVLTPLLHEPLGGPAYVVSRGHAATPEIGLALRSEGLLIEVLGQARAKGGVLSVDFGSLPDVPFAEVDVTLAAGPHSLLAANLPTKAHDSICGQRLQMPSEVTGQNGAVVKQSTVISVSGCHRARRTHREGGR